jgi:UDP-glucose 4-epimerase
MDTMRVLVTGGAGYIGSVTAAALLAEGHEVVVVDDLRRGHRDLVPAEATFIEADAGQPEQFLESAGPIDACLHFAAAIEAGESMQIPEAFFTANTAATLRLLQGLVEAGIDRLVFSSTAAVYGDPESIPIREDDSLRPTNAYGESKLLVERALEWLARLRGLRSASLRYFNASGATPERGEDHDPESHLIPIVLQVAAGLRENVSIYGTDYPTKDGTCVRDYIHVADLAAAHVAALYALADHDRLVCNLGNGTGFTVQEVIESARRVTGHPIPAVEAQRRAGDPAVLVADSARAKDVLGWKPEHTDLDEIVGSAWAWHQRRWNSAS